jgi:predicted HicB family RNase H-like nuclease
MKKQSKKVAGKVNVNVRMEPTRKAAYKAAAKKSRKTLSEWIRCALDNSAESLGVSIE